MVGQGREAGLAQLARPLSKLDSNPGFPAFGQAVLDLGQVLDDPARVQLSGHTCSATLLASGTEHAPGCRQQATPPGRRERGDSRPLAPPHATPPGRKERDDSIPLAPPHPSNPAHFSSSAPGTQKTRRNTSGGTATPRPEASTPWSTCAGRHSGRRYRPGLEKVKENNAKGLRPASAFTLAWLWLCSTGCFRRDHWLCKSRQCSVPGCRAPLRWSRRAGFLSAVSGSKERLAFLSHIWNLGWHHGDEILQL